MDLEKESDKAKQELNPKSDWIASNWELSNKLKELESKFISGASVKTAMEKLNRNTITIEEHNKKLLETLERTKQLRRNYETQATRNSNPDNSTSNNSNLESSKTEESDTNLPSN